MITLEKKNPQLSKWLLWSSFALILLVGFILRVRQLTATDYWYDEAFTAIVIRVPWKEMWAYLAADKLHPPIFYLILRGWTALFGTSLAAIRSVSLLFGMAILPMVYAIIQQLHFSTEDKQKFGLIMMAFFSLSPFFATYSVEARSYSFLAFLILFSVFLFLKTIEKMYSWSWYFGAFLLSLVAIALTHYLSILIILGYIVAYTLLVMIDKKWFFDARLWVIISSIAAGLWIAVTYFWHAFNFERFISGMNLGWIPQADISTFIRVVYAFLFGVDRQSLGLPVLNQFKFPLLPNTVGIVILISSLIAIAFAIQKLMKNTEQLRDLVVLISLGMIPLLCVFLASSLGLNIYVDRYVIGYGTMLLLTFGYAWWILVGKDFGVAVVIYAGLLLFVVLPKNSTKYTQIFETMNLYTNSSPIVVESPIDFVVLKAYFAPESIKMLQRVDGSYYDWALISHEEEKKETELAPGTLVVISKDASRKVPSNWTTKQEIGDYLVKVVSN